MKKTIIGLVAAVALLFGAVWLLGGRAARRDEITKMAERGASETEMLNTVKAGDHYALNADDVLKMKASGVSSAVIVAMLNKP